MARLLARALATTAAATLGLLLVAAGPAAAAPPPAPIGLTLASAKPHYAAGEPPAVTFTVRNDSAQPCQVPAVADGPVQVTGATRDGKSISPVFATVYFGGGLTAAMTAQLHTLAPGASVSFPGVVVGGAERSTSAVGDGSVAALWPVSAAGTYELSAAYSAPALAVSGPPLCAGSSDDSTVTFTVDPAAASAPAPSGNRLGLVIAGAAVLVVLALVVFWLVRRRGRRGPPAVAGVLAALLVLTLGITTAARPSAASWTIPHPAEIHFENTVNGCMAGFAKPGGDPAGIMPTITSSRTPPVTIDRQLHGQGPNTTPTPLAKGGNGSSTILFNDYADEDHPDDGDVDPCTELYHELYHAYEFMKHTDSNDDCGSTGIKTDEVEASFAENKYRASHGLSPRTTYGGKPLPKSLDECKPPKKPKPPGKPGQTCKSYAGASGCATSNGDPHLLTFDGRLYDLQAVGEFVDVTGGPDLMVQTRQSPYRTSRTVAVNTAVAVRDGTDRLGFYLRHGLVEVHLNGSIIQPTAGTRTLPGGGTLVTTPSTLDERMMAYEVDWRDGSAVWVDVAGSWGLRVFTSLAADRHGKVDGLLGNADGDSKDEPRPRGGGEPLPVSMTFDALYHGFGDSWRVTAAESLFDYGPGESTLTYTDRSFPDRPTTSADLDPSTRDSARQLCQAAGVTDPGLLEACVLDAGLTGLVDLIANAGELTDAVTPSLPGGRTVGGTTGVTGGATGSDNAVSRTLTVPAPGQPVSTTFTGAAGQVVFVNVPTSTVPNSCGVVSLDDPAGQRIANGCIIDGAGYIDRTTLPVAGQYTVVLQPDPGRTGTAQIQIVTVADDPHDSTVDGAAVTGTVRMPGAVATWSFTAPDTHRVFINVPTGQTRNECGNIVLLAPDGTKVNSGCVIDGAGYIDASDVPGNGPYRVVYDPGGAITGQIDVQVIAVHDQQGSLTVNGPAATATIAQPGATASFTFTGTVGQKVIVAASGSTLPNGCGSTQLRGPDGVKLASGCIINGSGSTDAVTLTATGTYTAILDPDGTATGTVQLRITTD
jgi:hypothetical protein